MIFASLLEASQTCHHFFDTIGDRLCMLCFRPINVDPDAYHLDQAEQASVAIRWNSQVAGAVGPDYTLAHLPRARMLLPFRLAPAVHPRFPHV